jgi:8-oxo-dGTP diphosphatase
MIYKDNKILMQNRVKEDWKGYTLPGGHVELGESFIDATIREIKEETGLIIKNLILCGVKQFPIEEGRYIVFLYKTNEFEGNVISSDEGEVEWVDRVDLRSINLVNDFLELLKVFDEDNLSEFLYVDNCDNWNVELK